MRSGEDGTRTEAPNRAKNEVKLDRDISIAKEGQ
jgi:hypothetical protein